MNLLAMVVGGVAGGCGGGGWASVAGGVGGLGWSLDLGDGF